MPVWKKWGRGHEPWDLRIHWGPGHMIWVLGTACVVGTRSMSPWGGGSSGAWVTWPGSLGLSVQGVLDL